jgi:hypothetical protein
LVVAIEKCFKIGVDTRYYGQSISWYYKRIARMGFILGLWQKW